MMMKKMLTKMKMMMMKREFSPPGRWRFSEKRESHSCPKTKQF